MKNIENLNTPGGANMKNESQNSNPKPTIGVEYFNLSHPNRNNKSLLVKLNSNKNDTFINSMLSTREVGGSMKSIWEKYYTNSNGIIFTLDISNTLSLAPALIEFQRLIQSETGRVKTSKLAPLDPSLIGQTYSFSLDQSGLT